MSMRLRADSPNCLRCSNVWLSKLRQSAEIAFFECPACRRQYAKKRGRELTYRWLHPVSLLLYALFRCTDDRASQIKYAVRAFNGPKEKADWMVREIKLELESPTQRVCDILDSPVSEEQCRLFLGEVLEHLEGRHTSMKGL